MRLVRAEGSLRAVCYSEVSSIASIIPVVGGLIAIVWWIVLAVQGTKSDEVLDAACGKIGIQLDLKEGGYEVELITRALEKCTQDKLVVTTHNSEVLRRIKEQFHDLRTGLTREHPEQTDADFLCLDQQYVTNESLSFCEQRGIDVWVWTVDNRRLMERLVAGGRIRGLITNRPDRALKLRSARS